jgi:large subunit ribosomal protein L10
MLRQEKERVIEELSENLARSTIVITTDFRGLPAKEMVQLRQKLREAGVEYRVAKNTLSRFAAEKAGKKQLEPLLTGPLALVFGYDDVVKPAQALRDHIRSSGSVLKITGGILGDRLLLAEDIVALASIPSREVLIAQILGQLQAPLQGAYNVLRAPLQGLLNVLQARVRCSEGG